MGFDIEDLSGPLGDAVGFDEFLEDLFTGTDASINTQSALSSEQKDIERLLGNYLTSRIGQGMDAWGPTQAGEGNYFTAPLNQLQQIGQGLAQQYAQTPANTDYMGTLGTALQGMSPEYMTGFYEQFIKPEQERIFQNQTLPGVREAFVGTGTFQGGPRMTAEANAYQQYGGEQGQMLGNLIMQGRESAFQALPYAAQLSQAAAQEPYNRAAGATQMGEVQRLVQQQELTSRFDEFKRTQPELSPIIDQAMNLLGLSTTVSYGEPAQAAPIWQMLEAAGPLAAMAMI